MKTIDDYSIKYESVIRRIYNCKRYGNKAADADIYRHLLDAYNSFVESNTNSFERNKDTFKQQCKQVSDYLIIAANKVGLDAIEEQQNIHGINIQIDNISDYLNKH